MDPCIECQLIVSERHHAIQCDNCELWQHRVCGTGVYSRNTERLYKVVMAWSGSVAHVYKMQM